MLLHGSLHLLFLSFYSTPSTNFIQQSAATTTNALFGSQCNKTIVGYFFLKYNFNLLVEGASVFFNATYVMAVLE
jgi:hypothetical protein